MYRGHGSDSELSFARRPQGQKGFSVSTLEGTHQEAHSRKRARNRAQSQGHEREASNRDSHLEKAGPSTWRRPGVRFIAWASLVVALALITVSLRLALVRLAYENDRLDRQIQKEQATIEIERSRLAESTRPARLEALAKKFGMVRPTVIQFIEKNRDQFVPENK